MERSQAKCARARHAWHCGTCRAAMRTNAAQRQGREATCQQARQQQLLVKDSFSLFHFPNQQGCLQKQLLNSIKGFPLKQWCCPQSDDYISFMLNISISINCLVLLSNKIILVC